MDPKIAPPPTAPEPSTVTIDLTATEAAWKKHEPRARALHPKAVHPTRIDVTVAAAIALAGVRNVQTRRDELQKIFCNPPLDGVPSSNS
jgi:hypothetical protein